MKTALNINIAHIKTTTKSYLDARIINPNVPALHVSANENDGWTIIVDKAKFGETIVNDIPTDLGNLIMFAMEHAPTQEPSGTIAFNIDKKAPIINYMPRYKYLAHDDLGQPGLECCYQGPALLYCKVLNEHVQLSMTRKDD